MKNAGVSSLLRLKILVCALVAVSAYGQPMMTLQFCNDCLPSPPDRLVRDVNGNPLVGTNYVAQLYWGMDPGSLLPTTATPARFKPAGTPSPGTWQRITLNFFTPAAGPYYLQVRVWDTDVAPTYEQAAASATGQYGRSEPFVYNPCSSPTVPPLPLDCEKMLNFRGFRLMTNPSDRLLVIRENEGRAELLYQGTHTIQTAPALVGPWTTIYSSTAPFIDPGSGTNNMRFYRMRDDPGPTYSVNAVGYYRLNLCAGYTMIANHFNALGGNTVTNILKSPPDDTQTYKFNGNAYDSLSYIAGIGWDDGGTGAANSTMSPGEGVFLFAPSPFTQIFLGDVPLASAVPIFRGWNILSSPMPQGPAPITDEPPSGLGFPVMNGDTVFQFRGCGESGYIVNEFIAELGWRGDGNGSAPVIKVGESFFLFRGPWYIEANWIRNFSVGQ